MATILMLGASADQLVAIRTAKTMGLRVIAVDMNPDSPGFKLADDHAVISTRDVTSEPEIMTALPKPVRDAIKVFDFPGKGLLPTFKGSFVCHVHRDACFGGAR